MGSWKTEKCLEKHHMKMIVVALLCILLVISGVIIFGWIRAQNSPPTAKIIIKTSSVALGENVIFDGSMSTDDKEIIKYAWDFGDGSIAEGKVVTHSYTVRGEYVTSLTVTDNDGLTGESSITMRVNNPPVAKIAIDKLSVKIGEDVFFNGSASTGDTEIEKYLWQFGDGSSSEGVKVMHTYTLSGIFLVSLTIIDKNNLSAIAYANVTVVKKSIWISCGPVGTTNSSRCTISNADYEIDFSKVRITVFDTRGNVVALWNSPITYVNGIKQNDSASSPVLIGKVVDNGDTIFGIGDEIYLTPESGKSLIGFTIKAESQNAEGAAVFSGKKSIGITCTKDDEMKGRIKCTIVNADISVEFSSVAIRVSNTNGATVAIWNPPITYTNYVKDNDSASSPILIGRVIDNGNNIFGIGDIIYLVPEKEKTLTGFRIRLYSADAEGIITLP